MKKLILSLFSILSFMSFSAEYDREEYIIENKLYKIIPILERENKILLEEIDVEIENDGGIEIEVELSKHSQINPDKYQVYSNKVAEYVQEILKEVEKKELVLRKIKIETSDVDNFSRVFRY